MKMDINKALFAEEIKKDFQRLLTEGYIKIVGLKGTEYVYDITEKGKAYLKELEREELCSTK